MRFLRCYLLASICLLAGLPASHTTAQDLTFFRIATGGVNGTYYPIGALVGNAISNPPGSRPCDEGGSCGVKNLLAIAQSSGGSVANAHAVNIGEVDSAFSQADIASYAYFGQKMFQGQKLEKIRALANLYPEAVQIVARKDAGVSEVSHLRGKRVSIDEPGSGTLFAARITLDTYGLREIDYTGIHRKPGPAASMMERGELDAIFIVAGAPTRAVDNIVSRGLGDLIPIQGDRAEQILKDYPFFAKNLIPGGTYPGVGDIPTISVGAQWIVNADQPDDRIYEICKSLWNEQTRHLLDDGHPKGKAIRLETALDGIAIPLHPGAEKCYRELGVLK